MGFHKFAALLLIQVGKLKFADENESLPDIKEKCKHLLLTDEINWNNIVNSTINVMLIYKCKGHLADLKTILAVTQAGRCNGGKL